MLDMPPVARLFHGIVVMGAALGCGGRSERVGAEGATGQGGARSGTAGAGPASGAPNTGAGAAGAAAGGAAAGGAAGRAVIAGPKDCAYYAQFDCADPDFWRNCQVFTPPPTCSTDEANLNCFCNANAPQTAEDCPRTQQFTCWGYYEQTVVGCRCDPNAPLAATDCAGTQQYHCRDLAPEAGCECNLDAPLAAADCTGRREFTCRSYEPPTDCKCVSTIILTR